MLVIVGSRKSSTQPTAQSVDARDERGHDGFVGRQRYSHEPRIRKGPAHEPALDPVCLPDQANAALTWAGENGTRRMRTPVASKIAFAIAADSGRIEGSPAPVGASSGWLISTTSTSAGVS